MDALSYSMKVMDEFFPDERRECWEQQADEARAHYESGIVEEARAIAAGRSAKLASREHLRVLLDWLDGARFRLNREQPEVESDGDTPPF
jgi:hypothetical protein